MELEDLIRRLEYERGGEHENSEVVIMTPDGYRYGILSVNWDDEHGQWVIIGEGL